MPEIDDADGSQPHLKGDKKMPKVPKQKVKEACNHTEKGDECPVPVSYTHLRAHET